ncbi:recombinase family protein [Singulisphaera acidiphila]|uniref:Site-specific recombinase, DNA invertase Pin n=1 Tax=Singulisphaera acidiphila (strain ATCC BAA-1392 / DSM 18658 / VKM B-2454 / MOB10) TaxID=886293 RepID=H1MQ59_SINAD|nr:recombinase family protein [Singulisphaera acidiphila]AGA24949.1 site-specific recombinase, DNA invertase Pin [Singulisphaera acidiphila DSM 18658]AGA26489.1 site-specific recombinase, DNA invertase Pin [Singulisphaera acidiphila DSM 18658]AGA26621.1 site-specific recombinase, DNA invertase Pin [Singulisphaera acidiphila DSM 18658]AGA30037.1 site-specific recombinase, DNA invertase Pin [Singulisphaera acidiphila DSM 18658]
MNIPDSTSASPTHSAATRPVIVPAHLLALRPAKVRDHHLDRKAIVYVRQSSPQQVAEHKESTARQYALAEVAVALGWPRDRVEVVDADQGRTAQTVEGRRGIQYILAELSLDHVGILLGQDASRLARHDPDWVPMVRSCGLFRALLGDYDGLYDPTDFNDRLLLGMKGIMSEAELHFLRTRMHEGRLNKARRGELFNHAPLGYVREPGRGLALDPDEQAREVVRIVFDQFDRQGSLHGLLRYLVHHGIRLPVRPHSGPDRGKLEWRRPNRETLQNVLHHPVYAGYYRHGCRTLDPRRKVPGRPGTGRTINKPEDCAVLLEGRCPAYITPERFRANQERLAANRARSDAKGAVRQGPSLLGGILRCGRCGQRMMVTYGGPANRLRYYCARAMVEYAAPLCQGLAGSVLDDLVAAQVLAALEPAALELDLAAADDLDQERGQLHRNWRQRVERARFEAERARRQYDAVEPENRLVLRELERRWEEALKEQRRLEEEYARFDRDQPRSLSACEREQIRALARDLPALWHAPATTSADRQRIVRLMIEEVVVTVRGNSECVDVNIQWDGSFTSGHALERPVQCYQQMAGYAMLLGRIDELREAGRTLAEVAEQLNCEGFHPPKRSARFTSVILGSLLAKRGRTGPRPRAVSGPGVLGEHEWLLTDLARELKMPQATLHRWIRVGWVHARKLPTPGGQWVIWADAEERERMTRIRTCPRGWSHSDAFANITKPKSRDSE